MKDKCLYVWKGAQHVGENQITEVDSWCLFLTRLSWA